MASWAPVAAEDGTFVTFYRASYDQIRQAARDGEFESLREKVDKLCSYLDTSCALYQYVIQDSEMGIDQMCAYCNGSRTFARVWAHCLCYAGTYRTFRAMIRAKPKDAQLLEWTAHRITNYCVSYGREHMLAALREIGVSEGTELFAKWMASIDIALNFAKNSVPLNIPGREKICSCAIKDTILRMNEIDHEYIGCIKMTIARYGTAHDIAFTLRGLSGQMTYANGKLISALVSRAKDDDNALQILREILVRERGLPNYSNLVAKCYHVPSVIAKLGDALSRERMWIGNITIRLYHAQECAQIIAGALDCQESAIYLPSFYMNRDSSDGQVIGAQLSTEQLWSVVKFARDDAAMTRFIQLFAPLSVTQVCALILHDMRARQYEYGTYYLKYNRHKFYRALCECI